MSADPATAPGQITRRRRIAARIPPLLRDRAFRRYWSGQTVSMFGDQISSIVLPLVAVLTLRSSAAQMGILVALEWVPSLLFAMHAGAWVDRRGRRRATMIAADLGRAALLASIPACYAFGVLTVWQLYGVAFGTGTLSVLFTVSDPALFVALVPRDRFVEGNSLVYGSRALSFVGGPSVGGLLVGLLTAPIAVVADAISFLGSAFFLSRIRPAEAPPEPARRGALTAGATFAVNYGTRPLGALAGGFGGTVIGLRPTLWIAAVGGMTGFLCLLPSPLPRFRLPIQGVVASQRRRASSSASGSTAP